MTRFEMSAARGIVPRLFFSFEDEAEVTRRTRELSELQLTNYNYKLQLAHTETKLKSANEQLYRLRRKTSHGANDGSENVRDIYKQKEKEQSKEEQSVAIAKKNKEEPSIAITFCRLLFVWLTCWLVTSIVDGPSYY